LIVNWAASALDADRASEASAVTSSTRVIAMLIEPCDGLL
jgi:hypothetical protein